MTKVSGVLLLLASVACGPKTTSTPPSAPAAQSLTAEECTAKNGEVVGDIGDGAIHRPEYRCPQNGQPPLGHITAAPGEPVAIEGAVCCGRP
jgi:hypothetical protein